MNADEEALLVDIRADLMESAGDTLGAVALLIDAVRSGKGTLAVRYPLAMRAAGEARGARIDSLDENRWFDLVKQLGTMGESHAALGLLDARRAPPRMANAEFNRAFVLMQFFGYLRRNPNDPQDTDYTGYDFWLTKLNQFNGNFINAEMVKAFISSGEYRERFGP